MPILTLLPDVASRSDGPSLFYLHRTAPFEGFSIGRLVTDPLTETNWSARYSGPPGRRLFSIRHLLARNALTLETKLNQHARHNYCWRESRQRGEI